MVPEHAVMVQADQELQLETESLVTFMQARFLE